MEENQAVNVKVSVRDLVEFILNSGDIDNTGGRRDPDAMQEGARLHRKIQKKQDVTYNAEVPLSIITPVFIENEQFDICVEGRADGIITREADFMSELIEKPNVLIDEIKCVYRELSHITEMISIHRAQVMCYAYIYAKKNDLAAIGIQLTYCNMETEQLKYFEESFQFNKLNVWFLNLVEEYGKWVSWHHHWRIKRDATIKNLEFPFEYRPGQKDLVAGVYRTILREKKLFIEAPTGVGKTISTVFPTVRAMGEGKAEKIFYLTAKTITRTVAEDTFGILLRAGLCLKIVTITAKEKVCILDKMDCNPGACERAKGHYDRVNDAVYDMLTHEEGINRDLILSYAEKHCVCPYEMCLDVTTWADGIICDYNYAFDPVVYLKRFFMNDKKRDYVFLIDEAHNLVDRAREMYSATLYKHQFLEVKRYVTGKSAGLTKYLEQCNQILLRMKRECDDCEIWENAGELSLQLMRLVSEYDEFFQSNVVYENKDEVLNLYLSVRHFLFIHEILDENYLIYSDYDENGEFRIKLMCMDPSKNLLNCLNKGKSAVFFSATLLPIQYYKEQLGGGEEDYAVYAPSPFDTASRLLMVGSDVSTKYSRRSESEYEKIVSYIDLFTRSKKGNYFVFFPSYQMMNQAIEIAAGRIDNLVVQKSNMSEQEKEEFLQAFEEDPMFSRVGFCVMGGIFSEGIDLKNDRLIGAVIVGTGLPMVCNERELFRGFYDIRSNSGFDYAYLYQGMNKVLQSAGRVIRTQEDHGAILLLDERFLKPQYQNLFPREWFPYETVRINTMEEKLKKFWNT